MLEPYNLNLLVKSKKELLRTRIERVDEKNQHHRLREIEDAGKALCEALTHGSSRIRFNQISDLLKREFPEHYEQLSCERDEDGFTNSAAKNGNYFDYWLHGKDIDARVQLSPVSGSEGSQRKSKSKPTGERPRSAILKENIWDLSRNERILLVQYWGSLLREEWINRTLVHSENFSDATSKLDLLRSEYSARALEGVDVIGLTTTGLARNTPLLARIKSKTLVCEEAGEVLEVSTIQCMTQFNRSRIC